MQRTESDCASSLDAAAEWSAAAADIVEEIERAEVDFDLVTLEEFKRRLVRRMLDRNGSARLEQATAVAT